MDKAIITGATGLVGLSVAKYLSSLGVQLLCLGRRTLGSQESVQYFGEQSIYISLSMRDISALSENLQSLCSNSYEGAVFYNFAWSGKYSLSDGSYADQLQNAVWSAEAVKVAKSLGCSKFINSGSIQETFIEDSLKSKINHEHVSAQADYGLAKLASRDMCRMVAYLEGIDYIHTRMSVPLDSGLSKGTYISSTLKNILNGEEYEEPRSSSLYDIVLLEDVARAYYLIGQNGLNKADYYIGTGKPATLHQFFDLLTHSIGGQCVSHVSSIDSACTRLFDVQPICQDVGFVAALGFQDIIRKEGAM